MGNEISSNSHYETSPNQNTKNLIMLTYKPDIHHSKLVLVSDDHLDIYTNNLALTKDLPEPKPTDDEVIFNLTDPQYMDILQAIVPEESMKVATLVRRLTNFSSSLNDADKVKLLYLWLTAQDITEQTYRPTSLFETVNFQLRKLQTHDNSYAALFMHLCNFASIPCVVVRGRVKRSPDEIGEAEWNAVLIDNNWRFVDSFWGAQSKGSLCPITYYLFPDPKQFIYTHWAESLHWQLLNQTISRKSFEAQEYLTEKFFLMNMRVVKENENVLMATKGEIEINFELLHADPIRQEFLCITSTQEGRNNQWSPIINDSNDKQPEFVYKKTNDKFKTIHRSDAHVATGEDSGYHDNGMVLGIKVHFPAKGYYRLEIIGNDSDKIDKRERNKEFDWVAVYKVKVEEVPQKQVLFPKMPDIGWGPNWFLRKCGLIAKSYPYSVIDCNSNQLYIDFEMANPDNIDKVRLRYRLEENNDTEDESDENDNEEMEANAKIVGNTIGFAVNVDGWKDCQLMVFAIIEGTKENVCTYLVDTSRINATDINPEMIKKLTSAMATRKTDELKIAIDHVKEKGYHQHRKVVGVYKKTCDLYTMLRNYERNLRNIREVDNNTILTLKSFNRPEEAIEKTMRATLLILGTPLQSLSSWEKIKSHLSTLGENSIQRRIAELDMQNLTPQVVEAARNEMKGLNAVEITGTSEKVASFTKWLESVFENYKSLNEQ